MAIIIGTNTDDAFHFDLNHGDNYVLPQGVVAQFVGNESVRNVYVLDCLSGGHSIQVYGALIASDYAGIVMGGGETSYGNRLLIGETGSVSVNSSNSAAIYSRAGEATIINHGLVAANRAAIIYALSGSGSSITNSGTILGELEALYIDGHEELDINNSGSMSSFDTDAIYIASGSTSKVSLVNSGSIIGNDYGIRHEGTGLFKITNSGTILGQTNTAIQTNEGAIKLVNTGTITGAPTAASFVGDVGADSVINKGTMRGNVNLFIGNDVYNGNGGRVIGTISGSNGNDKLIGGSFADVMNGGNDNDLLRGGGGRDDLRGDLIPVTVNGTLISSPANDTFDYNAISDSGPTAATRDIIRDFNFGDDKIDLSTIDANTGIAGNQAFSLLARGTDNSAVGRGEIGWYWIDSADNSLDRTILRINNDADAAIEMSIELVGLITLSNVAGADFVF